MRNSKRIIVSLLMTLIASVCFAVGCNTATNETQKPQAKATEVVLADFETWETGLQRIRTHAHFGKITWNKDTAYVKEGIGSAKLQPLGGYEAGTIAQFFYPTYSKMYDINNKDFSDAKSVTFEFYNTEDKELNVAVGLVTSILGPTNWKNSALNYQKLPAKQWTTITYEVDASVLSISNDITDIQGVYVVFENQGSRDLKDAPVVYLDNIVLHKYEVAPPIQDLVELGETEYMDFEKPEWQNYVISALDSGDAPTVSIVESAKEVLLKDTDPDNVHLSGKNSLKVVAPVATLDNVWPGVQFAGAVLQESLFNGLSQKAYGATTFTFEIYNASASPITLGMRFNDASEKYGISFSKIIPAKSWETVEYNIKDLYEDYRENNKKMDLFTNPGIFKIQWGGLKEETVLYIDNMRFEVEEIDLEAKPTIKVAPFNRQAKVGALVSLPMVEAIDKYDLSLAVSMKVFYQNGENWEEVALTSGKIPVEKAGLYKLEISTTNSLKKTTTVECYFEGLENTNENLFASYSYADETDSIKIGERTETNKVTFMEEVTIGGQTRKGVVKVQTDNKNGGWGVGFVGFAFAEEYLKKATEESWKSITVRMYIETETPLSAVKLFSSSVNLTPNGAVPVGKWMDFTITKNLLNNGAVKSYLNQSGKVMSDSAFYAEANEVFGMYNTTYLFYIATNNEHGAGILKTYPKVTYYIDEITWEGNAEVGEFDGEGKTEDIYDDAWLTPDMVRKKEELA